MALIALIATVLAACGGDSPPPPSTPTTTPTTAATPTPTTAATPTQVASVTPTAGTTGTPAPRSVPASIRIVGSDAFVAQVEAALFLLRDNAPEVLAWVDDSVATIFSVPFPSSSAQDVIDGTVRVARDHAFVPGYAPPDQVVWLSGELVRAACVIDLYRGGLDYSSDTAIVTCLEEQLGVLQRVDRHGFFIAFIEGRIQEFTEEANGPTAVTATPTEPPALGGIRVVGSDAFVEQVGAALQLLEERAPEAFLAVEEGIATIQAVPSGAGMDVLSKTYRVGEATAFAPGFGQEEQVIWLAGTIVHDACHSNLHAQGEAFHGKAAEVTCLQRQLEALDRIDDGSFFSNYIEELIEGADDPENQYWNDPNRHW